MLKNDSTLSRFSETNELNQAESLVKRVSSSCEDFWIATLVSGSSGNAYLVHCQGHYFLFDAGISLKKFQEAIQKLEIKSFSLTAIFITHEHIDHIQGLASIQKNFHAPIYTSLGTRNGIGRRFPAINDRVFSIVTDGETISWDNLTVSMYNVSHDAAEPLAFSIEFNSTKILILTDTGRCPDFILDQEDYAPHLAVIEANYQKELLFSGPYPYLLKQRVDGDCGHLSNEQSAQLIKTLALRGCQKFVLAHLSNQNNFPELANLTIRSFLKKEIPDLYSKISIDVAPRYEPLGPLFCSSHTTND